MLIYEFDPASWWKGSPAFWLMVPLILLSLAFLVLLVRSLKRRPIDLNRTSRATAVFLAASVAAVGDAIVLAGTFPVLDSSTWKTICGDVEQFSTENAPNTGKERFSVGGVRFDYWDKGPPGIGYHTTRSRGGVIEPGMKLLISYAKVDDWNVILRAERVSSCPPQPL